MLPNPRTVDCNCDEDMYPMLPKPTILDSKATVEI